MQGKGGGRCGGKKGRGRQEGRGRKRKKGMKRRRTRDLEEERGGKGIGKDKWKVRGKMEEENKEERRKGE